MQQEERVNQFIGYLKHFNGGSKKSVKRLLDLMEHTWSDKTKVELP